MALDVLGVAVKVIPALALLTALLGFAGFHAPGPWRKALAWSVVPVLVLRCLVFNPNYLADFDVFYHGGAGVRDGRDPYLGVESPDRLPLFNPPSALPMFVAFTALPYRASGLVWMALSVAGTLAIVEASRRALNASAGESGGRPIPPAAAADLVTAVALSTGSRTGLALGQLHVWVALSLVAAVWARGRGRSRLAGLALALGSVKPQTCLPFLLLFLRRRDWPAWVVLAALGLGSTLAVFPAGEVTRELGEMKTRIDYYARPGMINDYSYQNPNSQSLVNLEQLVYALGVRDRGAVRRAQLALLVLIGGGVALEVGWRRRVSGAGACALVSCFTMLFLYHRAYDAVVLAPALVYAAAGARGWRGAGRFASAAAGAAVLVAMNPYESTQTAWLARSWALGPAAGGLVRAFAVPYPTWACVAALGFVWVAARRESSDAPPNGPTTPTAV